MEDAVKANTSSTLIKGVWETEEPICKSHSYPLFTLHVTSVTTSVDGISHPVAPEGILDSVQGKEYLAQGLHGSEHHRVYESNHPAHVGPAIVIPTATTSQEPGTHQSKDCRLFFRAEPAMVLEDPGTPSSKMKDASTSLPLQSTLCPNSVLEFAESLPPLAMGQVPTTDPEPLYKKSPAVER